ncbi:MAG: hypothetical protein WA151_13965 [Desulfatirhabdiaceae bacterium]
MVASERHLGTGKVNKTGQQRIGYAIGHRSIGYSYVISKARFNFASDLFSKNPYLRFGSGCAIQPKHRQRTPPGDFGYYPDLRPDRLF